MTAPNLTTSQAKALLKELASVAEEASLTGAFSDGIPSARDKVNWLMAWAEARQIAPTGFFRPLTDKAGWGEIGVEARMMMASLKDSQDDEEDTDDDEDQDDDEGSSHGDPIHIDFEFGRKLGRKMRHLKHVFKGKGGGLQDPGVLVAMAPFLDNEDLAAMVTSHLDAGGEFDEGLLVALAPFLGSQTLGKLVRARFMRKPAPPEPPRAPEAPQAPQAAPAAPQAPSAPEAPKIPEAYPTHSGHAGHPATQENWSSAPAWTQNEGTALGQPAPQAPVIPDGPQALEAPQVPTLPPGTPGW
jgi:hypothetical protein